jgi:hypothetical protein
LFALNYNLYRYCLAGENVEVVQQLHKVGLHKLSPVDDP